ncbi:MAG: multicopper oxidase domain-containing protein [Verrucomicrobiota bacterium]
MSRPYASRFNLKSIAFGLLLWASVSIGQACEACRKLYFQGMENTPKASALYPQAKVVEYKLTIAELTLSPAGTPAQVLTINGGTPGPTLHFKEGDVARITVTNGLADDTTSLHWHGVLVPNLEDGVPGVSTPIIAAGKSRTFEFLIRQHGTYWYHSHTGHQLQRGVRGSIVIEPKTPTIRADHDQVVMIGDWTNEHPAEVQRTLLRMSDWYSFRKGTAQSLLGAYQAGKLGEYLDREKALVPPMDLSDVAYDAFLMNGQRRLQLPGKPGETVRVRLINSGAASYFYLGAATGPLKIISADGQDVVPFEQKRLLMGPAETYDLLVTIPADGSWELRADAQDGSGAVSAWLGEGTAHAATPTPAPERYGMSAYLTSILDQLDPEPGAKESERPLSPYAKLRSATPHTVATSHRELTLKLTGDMIRYAWSFDGLEPHEAEAIKIKEGESLRVRLVNNTMMHHPIHLHGHFFRLVDANDKDPATSPLKHTVDVPPMSVRTIEFTANEGQGDWLIHCHLLYHHLTGMVRTIRVTAADGAEPPHPPGTHSMPSTYAWGQAAFTTANYTGFITLQDGRNNWNINWDDGVKGSDGHEHEMSYQRYLGTRLSLFTGYRSNTMDGGSDGFFLGANYRLPYFIDFKISQQSGGELRFGVMKMLQLTERLSLDLGFRHGQLTGTSRMANLNYLLTKSFSLTAGYSSDFGAGIGLLTRF